MNFDARAEAMRLRLPFVDQAQAITNALLNARDAGLKRAEDAAQHEGNIIASQYLSDEWDRENDCALHTTRKICNAIARERTGPKERT